MNNTKRTKYVYACVCVCVRNNNNYRRRGHKSKMEGGVVGGGSLKGRNNVNTIYSCVKLSNKFIK